MIFKSQSLCKAQCKFVSNIETSTSKSPIHELTAMGTNTDLVFFEKWFIKLNASNYSDIYFNPTHIVKQFNICKINTGTTMLKAKKYRQFK